MGSVVQLGQVATGRIWHNWGRWQLEGSEQLGQVATGRIWHSWGRKIS